MNETSAALRSALMQSLLKRIQYKVCVGCAADSPADNTAGNIIVFTPHLPPDFTHAVNTVVLCKDALNDGP